MEKKKENTSGYGSETSGDTVEQQQKIKQLEKNQAEKQAAVEKTGEDHCVRCHKDCVLTFFCEKYFLPIRQIGTRLLNC